MPHVAPLFAAALIVGIVAGVLIDAAMTLAITLTTSAAWAVGLLAYVRGHPRTLAGGVSVLLACTGWLLGAHAVDRALASPLRILLEQRVGGFTFGTEERRIDEPFTIEGRLRSDAVLVQGGVVLRLDVERIWIHTTAEDTAGGVSLGINGTVDPVQAKEWTAGRLIRAPALLRRPARYLNAGLSDQERGLARRGVTLVGTIKSGALVEVLARGYWWEELAARIRARTRGAMARHVLARGEQSAAIASAILIGDRAGLSEDTQRRLQEAGTYHVIAISGGNIAILAGLLLGALALGGLRGRRASLSAILVLTAYAVVAAGGPSVLRATAMAIVYLAVRLIDLRTPPANAIAIVASGVVIANPLQVMDVGFWFTFGATVALVTVAAALPRRTTNDAKDPNGTRSRPGLSAAVPAFGRSLAFILLGTVSVELALAPIAAFVFQRVTLAGLILNFAALPAMTVVQLGAMGVLAADVLAADAVARWLGVGVHVGSIVLLESARLLDYAPWLTWRVPSPLPWVMVGYYVSLFVAVLWWRSRTLPAPPAPPALPALPALVMFLWIIAAPDARVRAYGDGRLHLSLLDVGQGDSVLVTFPNGRTLLVDTGGLAVGQFDVGERVVGPALRARRLLRLDYLAVTHADADHVGGARALLRDFTPSEAWWGIPVANHEPTRRVQDEAVRQRTTWRTLQRGDRLTVGGVDLVVHHPPTEDWERQRVRNNDSLVIELRFGNVSMLLTGDIGREVEEVIAPTLDLLPLVVLKVAHHGSLTSSSQELLRVVKPDAALIGVGRGNTYGHPAPYVLGRLTDVGAEIFRTDLDGQVDVVTDGECVRVETFTRRGAVKGPGIGDQGSGWIDGRLRRPCL